MDQPRSTAALRGDPIRTVNRVDLKAKLDRGDGSTHLRAQPAGCSTPSTIRASCTSTRPRALYAAVKPEHEVVVYCSHVDCLASVALYRELVRRGYRNVRRYAGGLLDWEDAGLPLEGEMAGAR
jgi:rhodanese-related sulfurtransferase